MSAHGYELSSHGDVITSYVNSARDVKMAMNIPAMERPNAFFGQSKGPPKRATTFRIVIEYASPIWAQRQKRKDAIDFLNATLTKFLKRYLCIPFTSNNELTHLLCQTRPLFDIIRKK